MMTWQSIETAPRDGTSILIYDAYHGVRRAEFRPGRSGDWIILADDFYTALDSDGDPVRHSDATHWMPLPAPPEAQP